jgi:hypothetical protein
MIEVDLKRCFLYHTLHMPWLSPIPIGRGYTHIPGGSAGDWQCFTNQVEMRNNLSRPLIGFIVTYDLIVW